MTCGIYLLSFSNTDKVYIGQSLNIERRFNDHCYLLEKYIKDGDFIYSKSDDLLYYLTSNLNKRNINMALNFKNTKGKAQKNSHEAYTYKDGENVVRIIGGILPRYLYWVKGTNNKQIPVECLAFDREQEKFNNLEKDCVQEFYPELKCSWSYSCNCIATVDGQQKVVVLNLKKKLWEQICSAASDLGLDPTDYDDGFDIVFKRAKTGPLAYNVEYTLSQLKLKKRALTEAERALADAAMSIDEKLPRQTHDDIRALLERLKKGVEDEATEDTDVDKEAVNEL